MAADWKLRVSRLSRFEDNEVICMADKDATEEPRRYESIKLGDTRTLRGAREREESDAGQFDGADLQVLCRQGYIHVLLSVSAAPLLRRRLRRSAPHVFGGGVQEGYIRTRIEPQPNRPRRV